MISRSKPLFSKKFSRVAYSFPSLLECVGYETGTGSDGHGFRSEFGSGFPVKTHEATKKDLNVW